MTDGRAAHDDGLLLRSDHHRVRAVATGAFVEGFASDFRRKFVGALPAGAEVQRALHELLGEVWSCLEMVVDDLPDRRTWGRPPAPSFDLVFACTNRSCAVTEHRTAFPVWMSRRNGFVALAVRAPEATTAIEPPATFMVGYSVSPGRLREIRMASPDPAARHWSCCGTTHDQPPGPASAGR